MAVRPFVEAFGGELRRLEGVLRSRHAALESAAEALLQDAAQEEFDSFLNDAGSPRAGGPRDRESGSLRTRGEDLQAATLKLVGEAAKHQRELHRIALKADAQLGTSCGDDAAREFAHEPWTDKDSAG